MTIARGALLAAVGMAMAFVGAVFAWFAPAVAEYTGWPPALAFAVLVLIAPLLQPQFLAFALARHWAGRHVGRGLRAVIAIAAWLATEWALPRLFGDTLGHGLHPSVLLRQFADVAGAAGLTLALLAVNEALATAIARRTAGLRAVAAPLGIALALPVLLAGYGALRLEALQRAQNTPGIAMRIGLVQAAIVDYERLRSEMGAYAVVRHVLDTHYAMSRQAGSVHGVDALVWSETVYPTTFLQPRSSDGAALDAELLAFVRGLGLPLVFGTYARDQAGEYNAAAFVDPARGPLGAYRKTRLFPLTEYVPPALDGPALRSALPWAGTWRPGDGARVFPLRLRDGREVPALPLICRDDVDPQLGIDGARLGAQLIVGLSNDAWFTRHPQGAELHLTVAAFRSIETRLPQVRATTNGMSAVIDAGGAIVSRTGMGERRLLVADVAARPAMPTLAVRAGLWLGPLAAAVLAMAAIAAGWRRISRPRAQVSAVDAQADHASAVAQRAWLVTPWQRALIAGLRMLSRGAVLALGLLALLGDEAVRGMLQQLRQFAVLVLLPEAVAAVLMWTTRAWLQVGDGQLRIDTRARRIEIPLRSLVRASPWRLPLPSNGLDLHLAAGGRWPQGLALRDPLRLLDALSARGADRLARPAPGPRAVQALRALALPPHRLDHPLLKFALFPLVPALPAFRLHQHIAYGGTFGEWQTFGAGAWLGALALWWASWAVALVLAAGGLRLLAEGVALAAWAARPERARRVRARLLLAARVAYFVGIPSWLLLRLLGG